MVAFVLVHGGGHGGWCWRDVAGPLRSAGHDVYTPTLTGLGERSHLVSAETDLDTHIEDVVSLMFYEDVTDAILVGHSYGGMVITGTADRACDRVRRLVYLDAAIPAAGEALLDSSPGLRQFDDSKLVGGVALGLWPEAAISALYGLHDPKLADWALPRLSPHPWRSFETKLHLENGDRLRKIPRAIINCTQSLSRRSPETRHRWSDGDFVREIDTGHDLMLTEPQAICRWLLEIAAL